MTKKMHLTIRSHQGDYPVEFLDSVAAVVAQAAALKNAVIAIDQKVLDLYRTDLDPLLKTFPVFAIPATEEEKSLAGVGRLATWMQMNDCAKQSILIAIGGGIVQDICALTAHLYYRGIPWVFVPTTLLSMSDSCIGAKSGVNHNEFKNQLGAFQSPTRVLLCSEFVKTLTDHDVASGYGEILKLALTGSQDHFDRFKDIVSRQGLRNAQLADLIFESLSVKKVVIEEDEYEKGIRKTLNYGHSFGHALESLTQYEVPHGLAVAWGMDLIHFISLKRGLCSETFFYQVHDFIKEHLPFKVSRKISTQELIQGAKRDKKVADGQISLILTEGAGKLKIVKTQFDADLESQIAGYLKEFDVFR